jgi:hypothetical protein
MSLLARLLLLPLGLLVLPVLADPPGAQDLQELPRFPRSEIVAQARQDDVERVIPQGAVRRISGRLRYREAIDAQGRLTRLTYQLPESHTALEAFDAARESLLEQGAHLLFWCQGRDCGESSLWANSVFDDATLYGPDDNQAYALLRLDEPRADTLLLLYAITRGNRRAYLHVERLEASTPLGELLPTPATLLRQLRDHGELQLPRRLAQPSAPWADALARCLELDSLLRVRLSGPAAKAWTEALEQRGIQANRLRAVDASGTGLRVDILR